MAQAVRIECNTSQVYFVEIDAVQFIGTLDWPYGRVCSYKIGNDGRFYPPLAKLFMSQFLAFIQLEDLTPLLLRPVIVIWNQPVFCDI